VDGLLSLLIFFGVMFAIVWKVLSVLSPEQKNPFLYQGIGSDVARRRYRRELYTVGEVDAFMASLTMKEKALLKVWESNNPRPSYGRDWLRHPEDDYE
jgi:hypothetical protein